MDFFGRPQQQQQRYFAEEKWLVNIEKTLAALKTDVRSLIMQMQLLRQEVGDKLKK
jgi:hypothetical protein